MLSYTHIYCALQSLSKVSIKKGLTADDNMYIKWQMPKVNSDPYKILTQLNSDLATT